MITEWDTAINGEYFEKLILPLLNDGKKHSTFSNYKQHYLYSFHYLVKKINRGVTSGFNINQIQFKVEIFHKISVPREWM